MTTNETALREALEPFAKLADAVLSEAPADADEIIAFTDCTGERHAITLDQFRAASLALQSPSQPVEAEAVLSCGWCGRAYAEGQHFYDDTCNPCARQHGLDVPKDWKPAAHPQASPPPVQGGSVTQADLKRLNKWANEWPAWKCTDEIVAVVRRLLTHSQTDTQEGEESRRLRIGWWNDMRKRGVTQDDAIAKINAALASPQHGDAAQQQEQQP